MRGACSSPHPSQRWIRGHCLRSRMSSTRFRRERTLRRWHVIAGVCGVLLLLFVLFVINDTPRGAPSERALVLMGLTEAGGVTLLDEEALGTDRFLRFGVPADFSLEKQVLASPDWLAQEMTHEPRPVYPGFFPPGGFDTPHVARHATEPVGLWHLPEKGWLLVLIEDEPRATPREERRGPAIPEGGN